VQDATPIRQPYQSVLIDVPEPIKEEVTEQTFG
jgi:hypothetical protein